VTIAKRDLSSLSREKTIVLALIIQLFIAAFSSFLVVGLTSLYDPSSAEGQGNIEVAVSGEVEESLLTAAERTGVQIRSYDDRPGALTGFENGVVNAVVSTSTVETDRGTRIDLNAVVPAESLQTTLIINQLRELLIDLERIERGKRDAYLDFEIVEEPSEADGGRFTFTHTILIPLLLFLPPFISGSIAVDSLTEEMERGTLELLRVTPASLVDIVDGKAMGMIAIAPVQSVMWILLLRLNGISISHIPWLVALVTALATIAVTVGLLLGLVTTRRRQAQLLYSVLILVLFGGTLLLPEHPASTVARLSVDSATTLTFAHVAGFVAVAIALYALTRSYVTRLDAESL
jgi:ABC-type Na+ efflux pump permease subunit